MIMRKVIHHNNFSRKFPLTFFLVVYLFLDKFKVPGYVWGIAGTVALIAFVGFITGLNEQQEIDIFEEKNNK